MKLLFEIKKPAELVFDYLSDMQKFVTVHPVISNIELIEGNHYLVHETLKMAFIPVSFTYPITIEADAKNNTITMHAIVMKITHINMNFSVTSQNNSCVIEENIEFKSPLPIKSIMESIFKKQHALLFKNIENL